MPKYTGRSFGVIWLSWKWARVVIEELLQNSPHNFEAGAWPLYCELPYSITLPFLPSQRNRETSVRGRHCNAETEIERCRWGLPYRQWRSLSGLKSDWRCVRTCLGPSLPSLSTSFSDLQATIGTLNALAHCLQTCWVTKAWCTPRHAWDCSWLHLPMLS